MITFTNYVEPKYGIRGNNGFIIGTDTVMIELFYLLNALAELPTTVLLRGETGTGKETFAKALHYNGIADGNHKPFVAVNCAGIPTGLLESELFGYVKGAFTGAYKTMPGKFSAANGGTIFLDEIGDMDLGIQAKILRVLQERTITPVGSTSSIPVNVRVIAATNLDLEKEVRNDKFRVDLYYRVNVYPVNIPPLRERRRDIPLLVEYIIEKFNQTYANRGLKLTETSPDTSAILSSHDWPGNVRQLENVIEGAFVAKYTRHKSGEDINPMIQPWDISIDGSLPKETKVGAIQKFWYEWGVLALTLADLKRMSGVKCPRTFRNYTKNGVIYSEKLPVSGPKSSVIVFLTKSDLHHVFRARTEGYRGLEKRIEYNALNEIAKKPFKIYNIPLMVSNPLTMKNPSGVYKAVKDSDAHIIPARDFYFVLTEDNAQFFVPDGEDREQKVEALKSEVREHHKRFQEWVTPRKNKPKPLNHSI